MKALGPTYSNTQPGVNVVKTRVNRAVNATSIKSTALFTHVFTRVFTLARVYKFDYRGQGPEIRLPFFVKLYLRLFLLRQRKTLCKKYDKKLGIFCFTISLKHGITRLLRNCKICFFLGLGLMKVPLKKIPLKSA